MAYRGGYTRGSCSTLKAVRRLPLCQLLGTFRLCSDLDLAYALLVDYDGRQCQIEFNFWDAKQGWGLEGFMNVTPTGVTNAAHVSLFMVHVAYRLRADVHARDPDYSVLDLKAD